MSALGEAAGEPVTGQLGAPVAIHTVTLAPEGPDEVRLDVAITSAELLTFYCAGGVLALPAGAFRCPSHDAAFACAERLLEASRAYDVSLLFGIDVLPPAGWAPLTGPVESLLFACRGGEPLLWPATRLPLGRNEGTAPIESITARHLRLGSVRLGLVLGSEVFNVRLRRMLARRHPDAIVVLTHGGANERWHLALQAMAQVAPVVLTGHIRPGRTPAWAEPPPGWSATRLADTPYSAVTRYEPLPPPP